MKKTLILLLLALAAMPSFAQRDVKTLNRKTPAQIISILGQQPCKNQHPAYWSQYDFPDLAHLEFDSNETVIEVFIDNGDEHVFIDWFSTTSKNYCFLSDYVPGGFKVGDTLQKIQSFDFAKSKYGRNNPKNALHLGQDPKWYIAFQDEGYRLSFRVENNVIVEIWLKSQEVAEGYENKYDPFE